jgi:hypothetical protein
VQAKAKVKQTNSMYPRHAYTDLTASACTGDRDRCACLLLCHVLASHRERRVLINFLPISSQIFFVSFLRWEQLCPSPGSIYKLSAISCALDLSTLGQRSGPRDLTVRVAVPLPPMVRFSFAMHAAAVVMTDEQTDTHCIDHGIGGRSICSTKNTICT